MKLKLSLILIFAMICLMAWGCTPPQKPADEAGKTTEAVEPPAPEEAPTATGPVETDTTEEGTVVEPGAEGTEKPSEGEAVPEPKPAEPAPAGPSGEKVFKDKCSSCHNTGEGAPTGLKGVNSKMDKAGLKDKLANHMGVTIAGAELNAVIDYVLSL